MFSVFFKPVCVCVRYSIVKYKDKETQQRDPKTHRQNPSCRSFLLTWTTLPAECAVQICQM